MQPTDLLAIGLNPDAALRNVVSPTDMALTVVRDVLRG